MRTITKVKIGFLIVLLLIGYYTVTYFTTPGPYDAFSQCLTQKGAVMYGAMDWCTFTQGQRAMFGKSFKYITYKEYTEFPEETFGKIKYTPSWIINGQKYDKAQSFERLSQLTGCKI